MSTKRHPYVYPGKNYNLKFPPEYVAPFTPSKSGLDVQVFHPVKISRYVSYSVQEMRRNTMQSIGQSGSIASRQQLISVLFLLESLVCR